MTSAAILYSCELFSGMMTGWEIAGTNVEAAIDRQFANLEAEYLHIHFAAPGCYAARVDRVG